MSLLSKAAQTVFQTAVEKAPDTWLPGGHPDPLIRAKHGSIGEPVSRLDGEFKVTGTATFSAEFPIPGMVYGSVAFSTIAKGTITGIDTAAAEAAPGVVLVMTHKNAPELKPTPLFASTPKAAGPDTLPILQDNCVHWNGQPIALILAETQEQADHAKSLLRFTYSAEPATTDFSSAKANAHTVEQVQSEPGELIIGNPEEALATAPHSVDLTYTTPFYNHNAIELHGVTLFWADEDHLFIHDSSQAVVQHAWTIAQVFGLKEEQVHISSPYVGGGFGGKTVWHHHILGAAASKVSGRPVRIALSREGVFRTVGGRTTTEQRVAIGARDDGRFTALIHTGIAAMTTRNNQPEQFTFPARHIYAAESFKLVQQITELDMLANTFMRAPGESIGTFALECSVDALATRLDLDPVEFRILNEPEQDPTSGKPFSSRNLIKAYRDGAERFGWKNRNATPRSVTDGEWLVGMGCGTATYPYYRMPGGGARITITRDGTALLDIAAHEMGMGTSTVNAQVAADRLALPLQCVIVNYGDSTLAGQFLAGGSSQTASIGSAVMAAHTALIGELLKLADSSSPLHGLKPEEVISHNRGLCKADEPTRWESYISLLRRADKNDLTAEGTAPPPLEIMHWSMHSYGAIFAEVRVNSITGEVRVSRLLGSFDCGTILNPKTARSQLRGGMIMGIGLALMEETQLDPRTGRVANPSLSGYHVPVHMDVPEIDILWTDIPDPHTPMGAHGIGEIGITGTGAAIANAVYNATGKRVVELPITLDKLL